MTKEEALKRLRELASGKCKGDDEEWHVEADEILLDLIDDDEIREAYDDVPKWYA